MMRTFPSFASIILSPPLLCTGIVFGMKKKEGPMMPFFILIFSHAPNNKQSKANAGLGNIFPFLWTN